MIFLSDGQSHRSLMRKSDIFVAPPPVSGKLIFPNCVRRSLTILVGNRSHSTLSRLVRTVMSLSFKGWLILHLKYKKWLCPELPAAVSGPPSSFTNALDTVRTYHVDGPNNVNIL
jgi:hypothetical protein